MRGTLRIRRYSCRLIPGTVTMRAVQAIRRKDSVEYGASQEVAYAVLCGAQ